MIILPQVVKIKWSHNNKNHYLHLGYEFTNYGEEFSVYVLDLMPSCRSVIFVYCDYCNKEISKTYLKYKTSIEQTPFKLCCIDTNCMSLKRIDTNIARRGVKYPTQSKEVMNKARENSLLKYGKEFYTQTEEYKKQVEQTSLATYGTTHHLAATKIREKIEQTNLERYGVPNVTQAQTHKQKAKETNLKKYGVENVFQVVEFKEKAKQTMLERYGYEYNSQVPEIKEQIHKNKTKTMYEQGSAPTSRQQSLIHSIIGGELNFPVDRIFLDIAYPAEKIYVEYQGSGHDLDVIMGKMTKEEFLKKEIARYKFLKSQGWKMIEIISNSKYDYLPDNESIQKMINYGKEMLLSIHNFISFDVDAGTVRTNNGTHDYNFGKLRKTIKSHLQSVKSI